MSLPDSTQSSLSQQFWSRTVYIVAIVTFILLWMFTWSWQDGPILPTHERENQSSDRYAAKLDPLVNLPKNKQLCTSDTYNNGQWVKHPIKLEKNNAASIEKAVKYHCAWNFPHKCYRRPDEKGEFARARHILDYQWKPKKCELVPFDANAFSAYIADHPLLFVGDSINQLEYESMACLLGEKLYNPTGDTNITGGHDMWASQLVHESKLQVQGAVSLAYLRSDYLVRLDDFKLLDPNDDEGFVIGRGSNYPWKHALSRFHHIVLNTGPHWHTNKKWGPNESDEEMVVAYKKAMKIVVDYLTDNMTPLQRIWIRSTPYGHLECSKYTEPSKVPHVPQRKPGEFQWDMHVKFDEVWKDLIEETGDDRIRFFNVSSMANLRGDAHSRPDSDCLHTCLPGPVDDWNKLLFSEIAREIARIP
ncbi:GDSL/SGNH-like acyl-esterase family found in Pmr5 and Cas1p-domain-containing protein [Circinella umbellata]|nr:GDSL/SGNH-like acyl-esterase family found in Pmr5 and Cas1p-domain-containing protein [Circinella umbellata]